MNPMTTRDWSKPLNLEMEGFENPMPEDFRYHPFDAKGATEVLLRDGGPCDPPEHLCARPVTHHFRGSGVETTQDELRLDSQYHRILRLMSDGRFRTLSEIAAVTHDPEGSILRQLSYMDDPLCGGHKKNKRRRGPGRGLWEYQIILNPKVAEAQVRAYFKAKHPKEPLP